ncbi:substrate-binding periplasmic protein [Leeia aquatica]|uniref:Amino acid ABC transporter substrate-binding protein n=1 Tax=Leeia aquatica TaxID=2725557 RepID=A0A847SHL8_9NEIS|nr:transporter substrate-binding domain-containing protein [Leeia aquatica]NLR76808.1 amino acid ABC transporter substrate-binding protein [Leeia aquatica]
MRRFGLVLMMCLSMPWAWSACRQPLRVALEDWPPYVHVGANGQPVGLEVELLQAVAREAGCTVKFLGNIPRQRRMALFKLGKLDVMYAASDTPERRTFALFSESYRDEVVRVMADGSNPPQPLPASFSTILERRLPLLVPHGGFFGTEYEQLMPQLSEGHLLLPFEEYQQGVEMLRVGRARLIMGDEVALQFLTSRHDDGVKLVPLPFVASRGPVHYMLSKMTLTPADKAALDKAIAKVIRSGERARILARYGVQD